MAWVSIVISLAAAVASFAALGFARRSWADANRPLITVRTTTFSGGNRGFGLNIAVENTGNRPATDISLVADMLALSDAFADGVSEHDRDSICACFSGSPDIPVLANGRLVTNEFGFVALGHSDANVWKVDARIPIAVSYGDLDGRRYTHKLTLRIADDRGFAGTYWTLSRGG
jgi:hypothetical protein